jgi:SAM-dependent methyltransferase
MADHQRPAPFSAYTTPEMWDDPHISAEMLRCHLDPDESAASRPHAFIDRSVEWLIRKLQLGSGSRVLDLGCGPGLYAERLAARGVQVLGIDVSTRSLAHARRVAEERSLPIRLVQGSYLTVDLGGPHDAAILIYEDYCALSPAQRAILLGRVHVALRPGGRFLFDVTSAARFDYATDSIMQETNLMNGFWAAEPYLGTRETWTYPDLRLVLNRYLIKTAAGTRSYWDWMQCLTPDKVRAELGAAGFDQIEVFGDVAGGEYRDHDQTFAVLCCRAGS